MTIKPARLLRELIFAEPDPRRRLVVTPLLEPTIQLHEGSASIDLRLGTRFEASRKGYLTHIDTRQVDFETRLGSLQDQYYVRIGEDFVLHPGHFVLASTLEYLKLPANLVGNVVTRSSWGRYGLVIATAVAIQPGFAGTLTLELRNLAEIPLKLYPGDRIMQVFFYEVQEQDLEAFDPSLYLGATKPGTSKSSLDERREMETIKKFPR